jgi:hypothetical protein
LIISLLLLHHLTGNGAVCCRQIEHVATPVFERLALGSADEFLCPFAENVCAAASRSIGHRHGTFRPGYRVLPGAAKAPAASPHSPPSAAP